MTVVIREVTWGDDLVVATFHSEGGLLNAVRRIHAAVGDDVGTANTFRRLFYVTDPGELGEKEQRRAWLLLTAYGLDPAGWGISDEVVPSIWNVDVLRAEIGLSEGDRRYVPGAGADDGTRTRNILLGRQRL